jgi:hypothetical protein
MNNPVFFNKKAAKIDLCEKHHEEDMIQHVWDI